MTVTVMAEELDTFQISPDGATVRLGFRAPDGERIELDLPGRCIGPLSMTLPSIAKAVLQRRYGDPSLRLVFEVGHWSVERSSDSATAILTLSTRDGFEASFALPLDDLDTIGATTAPGDALGRAN